MQILWVTEIQLLRSLHKAPQFMLIQAPNSLRIWIMLQNVLLQCVEQACVVFVVLRGYMESSHLASSQPLGQPADLTAAIHSKLKFLADLFKFAFAEFTRRFFRFRHNLGDLSPLPSRSISKKHRASELSWDIAQESFEVEFGLDTVEGMIHGGRQAFNLCCRAAVKELATGPLPAPYLVAVESPQNPACLFDADRRKAGHVLCGLLDRRFHHLDGQLFVAQMGSGYISGLIELHSDRSSHSGFNPAPFWSESNDPAKVRRGR